MLHEDACRLFIVFSFCIMTLLYHKGKDSQLECFVFNQLVYDALFQPGSSVATDQLPQQMLPHLWGGAKSRAGLHGVACTLCYHVNVCKCDWIKIFHQVHSSHQTYSVVNNSRLDDHASNCNVKSSRGECHVWCS